MFQIGFPVRLTICLVLGWGLSNSQEEKREFFFEHYGPAQGLNTRTIRSIVQSQEGFMWMATNDGLVRYDGEAFTLFFDPAVPVDISNNRFIEFMIIDDQDRIWVANNEFLVIYHIHTDTWQYLFDSTGSHIIHPMSMSYDPLQKRLWVGCEKGLCSVDTNYVVSWYPFQEQSYRQLPFNTVSFQQDTSIWLGNRYGYYQLNPESGAVTPYHIPIPVEVDGDGIFSSYLMGDSVLWLGGWGTGLIKHDLRKGRAVAQYFFSDHRKELNAVYQVIPAMLNSEGHWLWTGTSAGLQFFDTRSGEFLSYQSKDNYDHTGVPGLIFSFLKDAEGAIWLGGSDGLFRFDAQRQGVEKIRFPEFEKCFTIGPTAFEKQNGEVIRLWFTIPYCGWHIYDLQSRQLLPFPPKLREALKSVGIFDILITNDRKLWIGTNEKGLLVYDLAIDQFTSFSSRYFKEQWQWVIEILEDVQGMIWLGTYDGMFRFDPATGLVAEIEAVREMIHSGKIPSEIHSLAQSSNGDIWATIQSNDTLNGCLIHFDPDTRIAQKYDRLNTDLFSTVHEFRDVGCDEEGSVMLSTDRGIFTMEDGDIKKLKHISTPQSNLGPSTYSLAVDNKQGVWVSNAFGVSRYNLEQNTINSFHYSNSLLGRQTATQIWYDEQGAAVYVAQRGGFDVIRNLQVPESPVQLQCLGLFVNEERVDTQWVRLHSLGHDQNDIRIQLALPFYSNSNDNVFRYRLVGYDREWTRSNQGTIQYNHLPPSQYIFEAVGLSSDGRQSDNMVRLTFTIMPPFWATWWFRALVLVLVSGMVALVFLFRERHRQRLQQMRDAIARDLHDEMGSNLSTIKLMSEFELLKTKQDENAVLRKILDKTNQVMESMYEIIWSIHPAKGQAHEMDEKIKSYILQTLEPLGIHIHFDLTGYEDERDWKLTVEQRRNLFLIFREAINNISKYASASEVTFRMKTEKRYTTISIADNGIGFDPKIVMEGHGMSNMKQRALSLRGEMEIKSAPGKGTAVNLKFKHG